MAINSNGDFVNDDNPSVAVVPSGVDPPANIPPAPVPEVENDGGAIGVGGAAVTGGTYGVRGFVAVGNFNTGAGRTNTDVGIGVITGSFAVGD
jgi:hypothetical protein